jgi:hypothetical protein
MLPLYRERVTPPAAGAVEIFLGEHEKLRQLLTLFKKEIVKIRAMEDAERGALFLIDSQLLFKKLLVHHDARERKMLYPLLDEATAEAERSDLFAKLDSSPASRRNEMYIAPGDQLNSVASPGA